MGVYNNYVHDFGFAGIASGFRMSEVMTASFVDVSQNLIIAKGRNVTGDSDATGIYWNTKWFSPGERMREGEGGREERREDKSFVPAGEQNGSLQVRAWAGGRDGRDRGGGNAGGRRDSYQVANRINEDHVVGKV